MTLFHRFFIDFYKKMDRILRHHLTPIIMLLFIPLCGLSATILVPLDYPTIQQAINAAGNGDEIIVSPGTYQENLVFPGVDIG